MKNHLLDRLDTWLHHNRPDFYHHLLPGATDADIIALEAATGLTLPATFRAFLQWKNGSDDPGKFLENWTLLSCTSIAGEWQLQTEWHQTALPDEKGWWNPAWLPFAYDYTGNTLCMDTVGMFGGSPGQIIEYWHDDSDRDILYPSFEAWLETVVLAMENGCMYYGEEGEYADFLNFSAIINPGYPIPFHVT